MGFLDELKKQAEAAKAQQTQDVGALERNALLADSACQSTFRYFVTLAQQLNVLQPVSKAVFRFDNQNSFNQLRVTDVRADSRLKKLRSVEVFDHVTLGFELKSGTGLTLAKDFPPAIDKLEAKLRQCGAPFESEIVRNPDTGRFEEKRFQLTANFHGKVRVVPDHDTAWLHFQIVNIQGFETVTVAFPAFEVGSARLDDLARWLVGEPHRFLEGGQNLRIVEV